MSSPPTILQPIIELQFAGAALFIFPREYTGIAHDPKATLTRNSFVYNTEDNGDYLFYASPIISPKNPSILNVVISSTKMFNVYTQDVGYTVTIKSLLALRLRALYSRNKKGELSKTSLFAAERALILNTISHLRPLLPIDPTSCGVIGTDTGLLKVFVQLEPIIWIIRLVTTSFEAGFMFYKFYETLQKTAGGRHFRSAVSRSLTPLLYVFYRDGLLMFIPSILSHFLISPGELGYMGSRLILNVRRANTRLIDVSQVSKKTSALRFASPVGQESTRRDDRIY
ncbi:hypothetical protein P691DRAFT_786647 [Macrolepiota fuliginosa MF-IS2]|uniref:Uncharacterized protein n=1 Tax=Macrolepiota fuliginosa MF-IS2 TaxID=1400762 RepID=A0A9P6C0D6_9AGAR|nr:hypothetical protein P691DRAFT_786647 [Macrolepiota fuliginosa MF-IS2]